VGGGGERTTVTLQTGYSGPQIIESCLYTNCRLPYLHGLTPTSKPDSNCERNYSIKDIQFLVNGTAQMQFSFHTAFFYAVFFNRMTTSTKFAFCD
jgi:hypothetical protein